MTSPVGRVMSLVHPDIDHHNNTLDCFSFFAIWRVSKPKRGDDWVKKLFYREAFWICQLHTRNSSGLNYKMDLLYIYWIYISSSPFLFSLGFFATLSISYSFCWNMLYIIMYILFASLLFKYLFVSVNSFWAMYKELNHQHG